MGLGTVPGVQVLHLPGGGVGHERPVPPPRVTTELGLLGRGAGHPAGSCCDVADGVEPAVGVVSVEAVPGVEDGEVGVHADGEPAAVLAPQCGRVLEAVDAGARQERAAA